MSDIIAFCGINCSNCEAYLATRNNDDAARRAVADDWSARYHFDCKPADINCTGCQPDGGAKVGHCSECGIRQCGLKKGVQNCAHCASYPCAELERFFAMVPDCKARLDAIHAQL
jgi:hypothetical protein